MMMDKKGRRRCEENAFPTHFTTLIIECQLCEGKLNFNNLISRPTFCSEQPHIHSTLLSPNHGRVKIENHERENLVLELFPYETQLSSKGFSAFVMYPKAEMLWLKTQFSSCSEREIWFANFVYMCSLDLLHDCNVLTKWIRSLCWHFYAQQNSFRHETTGKARASSNWKFHFIFAVLFYFFPSILVSAHIKVSGIIFDGFFNFKVHLRVLKLQNH